MKKVGFVVVVQYLDRRDLRTSPRLIFFLWGPLKEMTCRTKVHTRKELLHRIVDAAANIQEHREVIQWRVNWCLERESLCVWKRRPTSEQFQTCPLKSSNQFMWLILSFIFSLRVPWNRHSSAQAGNRTKDVHFFYSKLHPEHPPPDSRKISCETSCIYFFSSR
jgi:hypothetical protein